MSLLPNLRFRSFPEHSLLSHVIVAQKTFTNSDQMLQQTLVARYYMRL